LLANHVLGQMVSQQARIKLAKLDAGQLVDHHPLEPRIRALTGCTVIAVEREGEVIMDIPPELVLVEGDALYVCGTVDSFDLFYEEFAESRG
jgi:K+/H+ antiporter YhaU regulatory subunit KhtT